MAAISCQILGAGASSCLASGAQPDVSKGLGLYPSQAHGCACCFLTWDSTSTEAGHTQTHTDRVDYTDCYTVCAVYNTHIKHC